MWLSHVFFSQIIAHIQTALLSVYLQNLMVIWSLHFDLKEDKLPKFSEELWRRYIRQSFGLSSMCQHPDGKRFWMEGGQTTKWGSVPGMCSSMEMCQARNDEHTEIGNNLSAVMRPFWYVIGCLIHRKISQRLKGLRLVFKSFPLAMEFDRSPSSTTTEAHAKFQSNMNIYTTNPAGLTILWDLIIRRLTEVLSPSVSGRRYRQLLPCDLPATFQIILKNCIW